MQVTHSTSTSAIETAVYRTHQVAVYRRSLPAAEQTVFSACWWQTSGL